MIKNITAAGAMLLGISSLAAAGACLLQHFAAGDLFSGGDHDPLKACLALAAAGVAMFSPGLQAMKVGVFNRQAPPPTSPPGGAPTADQIAKDEAAAKG